MSIPMVEIVYVKSVQVGAIVFKSVKTEYAKVTSVGIVDDTVVLGFGTSSTGGLVFGRTFPISDIQSLRVL